MATEKNTNAKISKSNALFRGVFFVLVVDIVQQIVGNLFANCLQAYLYFGAFLHTHSMFIPLFCREYSKIFTTVQNFCHFELQCYCRVVFSVAKKFVFCSFFSFAFFCEKILCRQLPKILRLLTLD